MQPENTDFQRGYYFGLKESLELNKPEIAQIVRSYEAAGITITDEERLKVRPRRSGAYKKEIAYTPYFPIDIGSQEEDRVIQLQTALKRLGYYGTRIDGKFGRGSKRAVQAFQFDAELEPTGVVEKATADRLESLLYDETRWIIPMRNEVSAPHDQMALFIDIMAAKGIPIAFATALAEQEGNMTSPPNPLPPPPSPLGGEGAGGEVIATALSNSAVSFGDSTEGGSRKSEVGRKSILISRLDTEATGCYKSLTWGIQTTIIHVETKLAESPTEK
jgi:peptidoglycan hydrolase-like protein with peptidoglycan-binding domain